MAKNTNLAPIKEVTKRYRIKGVLQKPALTSFFQCWFFPTQKTKDWIKSVGGYNFDRNAGGISLLCSEASLPGSSFLTNEITSDYHGVTEKHAYRRQFDNSADFTFYVDHNGADGGRSHDVIWLWEHWISHIAEESLNPIGDKGSSDKSNYFYRFNFPKTYQTSIYINKFERDFKGTYLQYDFLQAYPYAISAMPVSYNTSEVLKCTVSFYFTRYNVHREYNYGIVGALRNNVYLNDPFFAFNPLARFESENVLDSLRRKVGGVFETFGQDGTNY